MMPPMPPQPGMPQPMPPRPNPMAGSAPMAGPPSAMAGPQPGGPGGMLGPQGAGGLPMQLAQAAAQQMAQGGQTEGLADLVAQLAKHLVGMVVNVPQAAQFQAGKELMETFRKWQKAEQTVPSMVPKMAATTPGMAPNAGRADQAAMGQMQSMQQAGMPPRGMPPQTSMPGQLSQLASQPPRPGGY